MKEITLRSKTGENDEILKAKISGPDIVINKLIRWFKEYNYSDRHLSRYNIYIFHNSSPIKTTVIKARRKGLSAEFF